MNASHRGATLPVVNKRNVNFCASSDSTSRAIFRMLELGMFELGLVRLMLVHDFTFAAFSGRLPYLQGKE